MKKSLVFKNLIAILLVGSAVFFASCIKDRNNGAPDFTQLAPIVQIINDKAGNAASSGLDGFSAAALLLDNSAASDSAAFRINYAATGTAPADITVTLAYNAAALVAYNAANPNPVNPYTKFPDSIYTFTQTTVVVKAGTSYSDLVKLYLKPNKIDITKNYMLPISITAVSGGVNISGNYGTIYYHLIGNPLAGKYNLIGRRYNYVGTVAYAGPTGPTSPNIPPTFSSTTNLTPLSPKSAAPVDGQTVTMSFSNLGFGSGFEYGYLVTGNATFSAITLGWNDAFISNDSNIEGFTMSYVPPSPTQKPAFRFVTHYNNAASPAGSGNDRIIDEDFTHQ